MPKLRILLAVVLATATACGRPEPPVAAGDASSPTPSATTRPSTLGGPPARFAAVTKQGTIVVADTASGRILETLVSSSKDPKESINGLSRARGSDDLYYSYSRTVPDGRCGRVMRVSLSSGKSEKIADGTNPSVSPSGATLAWIARCRPGNATLSVRDLTKGTTRSWLDESEIGTLSGVEFWPDERVVYTLGCGADACGLLPFDTVAFTLADYAPQMDEVAGRCCASMNGAVQRGKNIVFTVDWPDPAEDDPYPMVEVDPATGKLVATLFPDGRPYAPYDFDESGSHLLIADDESLMIWSDGVTRRLDLDVEEAIWLE